MHGVGRFFRAILSFFRMLAHWEITLIVLGALLLIALLIGALDRVRKRSRPGVETSAPKPGEHA